MVGREVELAALVAAASTEGGAALVESEAGGGRTALVDTALASLGVARTVYRGGADEMTRMRPFGLVATLFPSTASPSQAPATVARMELRSALHDFLGALGTDAYARLFRVEELVLAILEQETHEVAGVVVAEDLHWADPASLLVLQRVARSRSGRRWSLVCTTRIFPRRREVEDFHRQLLTTGASCITLLPLGAEAIRELVQLTVGHTPGPGLLAHAAKAGGNPRQLIESVAALREADLIRIGPDGVADADPQARVPSLHKRILRRLGSLDAQSVGILALAAVLGNSFTVAELSTVSGQRATDLAAGLLAGVRAGVLVDRDDRFEFRSELIWDAVYADTPLPLRRALHREVAEKLAGADADVLTVAHHFALGSGAGDSEAIEWFYKAVSDVAPRDPELGIVLARQALALAPSQHPLRDEFETELALALVEAGQIAEGIDACRKALDKRASPSREGALWFALARSLLHQGLLDDARDAAAEAVRSPALTQAEMVKVSAWAAELPLFAGDFTKSIRAAAEADKMASDIGDIASSVQARRTGALASLVLGQLREAGKLASDAVRIGEADGSDEVAGAMPYLTLAMALVDMDRAAEAADVVGRGREAAERAGNPLDLMFARTVASYGMFLTGEWDDALAELEAARQLAAERGVAGSQVVGLCEVALMTLWRQGPDHAQTWVARAGDSSATYEFREAWVPWAAAAVQAARGEPQQALSTLAPAWRACRDAHLVLEHRLLGPFVAKLAASAGERNLAAEAAAEVEAAAELAPGVASLEGAARRARGWAEGSADHLFEAVSTYRSSPRRPEHAAAAADAALLLARDGRLPEARSVGAEAIAVLEGLGAAWQVSRLRGELRDLGVRLGPTGSRRRARSGWESLTPAELRVVELAAQRLSNPEIAERLFISRRTVETHVSHALAKLGLSGRADLADAVAAARSTHETDVHPRPR